MDPRACKIAKEFVALAGLEPSTATVKDMDQLDLRIICQICGDSMTKFGFAQLSSKAVVSFGLGEWWYVPCICLYFKSCSL
jgi:hypothetical protein